MRCFAIPIPIGFALALLMTLHAAPVATARTLVVNPAAAAASDENPGTESRPFNTIGAAAAQVQPGDIVQIHTGVYREAVAIAASGTAEQPIRFEAAPGAQVVVTGADRLTDWRKESAPEGENVYSTPWPHRFITWSRTGTHPGDDYHRVIGRAEQVFVNGYLLRQVLSRDHVTRGAFFVDLEARRLYAQADNNADLASSNHLVEASARGSVWEVKGDHVATRGITFRYAANQAQRGMALFQGRAAVVEDCVFEWANTSGANFLGDDQVVRRCAFRHNGQAGFTTSHSHRLLVADCEVAYNNTKNFDRGWEAGAVKICLSRGVVLEQSRFVNNRGHGVWFDIGNEACVVRNCLIADNEDSGIFYEISYGLHAHDNVIVGNGFLAQAGSWGANGGVSLSSSPDCRVERNLIVGNREGFQFREQDRRTPLIDQPEGQSSVWVWNHDNTIRNNVLAFNRDAHVWGWFDVDDERHWPAALQREVETQAEEGRPDADVAAPYTAQVQTGRPEGLNLEKLRLTFADNLYFGQPGDGMVVWGTRWKRNSRYQTLDEARQELGLESGRILDDLAFANFHGRDFRLPDDHPAHRQGAYPRGDVPGVRLGAY